MKRPAILFCVAALLFVMHGGARLAGWAEHTSAIAGMPTSPSSAVLGPAFVVLHLLFIVVAPILTLAATLDTMVALRRR